MLRGKWMLGLTIATLVVAGIISPAVAQQGGPPPGGPRGGGMQNMIQMRTDRVFNALQKVQLDDQQKQTIEALRVEFSEKLKPLVDEVQTKTRDLRQRQQNDPNDQVGLDQMRQEITQLMDKMAKQETELTDKIRAILKEDQVKEFEQVLANQGNWGMMGMVDRLLPVPMFALQRLNLDQAQTDKVRKIMDEFRAQIEKLRTDYGKKVEDLLTPEQKKKLEEVKAQIQNAQGMMGRGMGPGGPRGPGGPGGPQGPDGPMGPGGP